MACSARLTASSAQNQSNSHLAAKAASGAEPHAAEAADSSS